MTVSFNPFNVLCACVFYIYMRKHIKITSHRYIAVNIMRRLMFGDGLGLAPYVPRAKRNIYK